jgi:hypothetical protein
MSYPLRLIGLESKLGNVLGQNRDNAMFVPLLQKVMTSGREPDLPRTGEVGLCPAVPVAASQ